MISRRSSPSITPLPTAQPLKHLSDPFRIRAAASRPSCNLRSKPAFTPSSCRTETFVHASRCSTALFQKEKKTKTKKSLSSSARSAGVNAPSQANRQIWHETRICPARSYPNAVIHIPSANERQANPPAGVAHRIQKQRRVKRRVASWLRDAPSVWPPRRARLSLRLQSALVPLCRVRSERRGAANGTYSAGRARRGERPGIQ